MFKIFRFERFREEAGGAGDGDGGGGGDGGENKDPGDGGGDGSGGAGDGKPGAGLQLFAEDGLTFQEGWVDQINTEGFDEVRAYAAQFKDLPTALRSGLETKRRLSQGTEGMVKVPGEDASDEEKVAFRTALGIPESAEAYGLSVPEGLNVPEGVEIGDETFEALSEFAAQENLPKATAEKLTKFLLEREITQFQSMVSQEEADAKADAESLRETFGQNYDVKMNDAKRAAATFGGIQPDSPLLQIPEVVKMAANVASAVSEGKLTKLQPAGSTLSHGSEARDIMKNPDNPMNKAYRTRSHPDHAEAVNRVNELLAKEVERERQKV